MKIPRDSIDLEESFHPAASLGVYILNHLAELFLVRHVAISVLLLLGKADFFEVVHDIHQVYFEDIFDVEGEEGAGIAGELNIDMHLQFLGQVLLVDYQITLHLGLAELDD